MRKLKTFFKHNILKIRKLGFPSSNIFSVTILIGISLFHEHFVKIFDKWILAVLSTIHSTILSDVLWISFALFIFVLLLKKELRIYYRSIQWFRFGVIYLVIYLYFRFFSEHYLYTGFSILQQPKYADVFALIVFLFAFVFRPRFTNKPLEISIDKEIRQVQIMIHSYIDMDTNYTLLLNGKRGTGKTFFIKNKVVGQISNFQRQNDRKTFYIPIYIYFIYFFTT